jgi:hypothetical protein
LAEAATQSLIWRFWAKPEDAQRGSVIRRTEVHVFASAIRREILPERLRSEPDELHGNTTQLDDSQIHVTRGQSVILDADMAALYAVTVKALLQGVRRNRKRFPTDFMFQLTNQEVANLYA